MAAKYCPQNERIKHEYVHYLRFAKRNSDPTIDAVLKSIKRFEEYTGFKDFKQFTRQQAMKFNEDIQFMENARGTAPLSRSTVYTTLTHLRFFFVWLTWQPGYKSRLSHGDADYFNLTEKQARIAKAPRIQRQPTLKQIEHVIDSIDLRSEVDYRDRALIAFTVLTGMRDGALSSLRLKHIDMEQGFVFQDARDVRTKNSKTIMTYFFPVGDKFKEIIANWISFLVKEKLWGMNDPLFPATKIIQNSAGVFASGGFDRECWANATPIREIFKRRFAACGLPYYNPHSFRHTLVLWGERICQTPEDFKAWSQNLGHDHVSTTFTSYGNIGRERQAEIIRRLRVSE